MNFKNLFKILLCLTVVSAESDFKGNCKDLDKIVAKKSTEDVEYYVSECALDKQRNAVD